MPKKSNKTSKNTKSYNKALSPTTAFAVLFVSLFAVIGAAYVFASQAASPAPTGTISIDQTISDIKYGGKVKFNTTVVGKLSSNSEVQTLLVCSQKSPEGKVLVVLQASAVGSYSDGVFPLQDSSSPYLPDWDPLQSADCTAQLNYRVEKGKGTVITTLDNESFVVPAQ